MGAQDKLCMSCMRAVPADAKSCPHCGYNGTQNNPDMGLPIGTRLKGGRYIIGMRAETDGDSVTYIAYDCKANTVVFVREFFLKGGCTRVEGELALLPVSGAELPYKTALVDFAELYRNLFRLPETTAVVRTVDFFEANGTAYAVLERFGGIPLRELLSRAGGTISFEQAYALLEPIARALTDIHDANLIHRGVSPTTIFINRGGDVRLGGFATSSVRTKGTEIAARLHSGYAAPEQYSVEMWQSTATDVYALAAVLYRCVTGTTPPDAEQRRSYDTLESAYSLNNGVPQQVSRAISLAMLVNSRERTQTMDRFLESLFEEPPTALRESKAATTEVPVQRGRASYPVSPVPIRADRTSRKVDPPPEPEKRGLPWYGIVLVVLAITAVCAVMYMVGKELLSEMPGSGEPGVSDSSPLEGEVPNYVGQNVNEIEKNETLFTYSYEFVVDADSSENTIIRQSPEPGTLVRSQDGEKTAVTLYVSRGRRVEMIGVVGNTVEQAQSALSALGIRSICIDEETASYLPGTVLRQSLEEGALVDPNSQTVTLYVASAPPPAEPEDEEQPEAGA